MATAPETTALLKRGKRGLAVYFKTECNKNSGEQKLKNLLNYLFSPSKHLDDNETLEWCRWLMAGGVTFDEFSKTGAPLIICKLKYGYIVFATNVAVSMFRAKLLDRERSYLA